MMAGLLAGQSSAKRYSRSAWDEVGGEALLAQNVGDGLGLALLQFPDLFLHRAGRDQADRR